MKEEIKHAASAVKQVVAHSPAAGWLAVLMTYLQTQWLDWGSVAAEMVSFIIGTLLALVLLANHSITLYKSITKKEQTYSDSKLNDKQG